MQVDSQKLREVHEKAVTLRDRAYKEASLMLQSANTAAGWVQHICKL